MKATTYYRTQQVLAVIGIGAAGLDSPLPLMIVGWAIVALAILVNVYNRAYDFEG